MHLKKCFQRLLSLTPHSPKVALEAAHLTMPYLRVSSTEITEAYFSENVINMGAAKLAVWLVPPHRVNMPRRMGESFGSQVEPAPPPIHQCLQMPRSY